MKMIVRPQPNQQFNHFRYNEDQSATFDKIHMMKFGYRGFIATLIGGGGRGGQGGARALSTYTPSPPVAGFTYYAQGGGGAGGNSGQEVVVSGSLQSLAAGPYPATVGGPGGATSFLGSVAGGGANGGNGGNATGASGGAAGVPAAAASSGDQGTAGRRGYYIQANHLPAGDGAGTYNGEGGVGGEGWADPFQPGIFLGAGGDGAEGAQYGSGVAGTGALGEWGALAIDFTI